MQTGFKDYTDLFKISPALFSVSYLQGPAGKLAWLKTHFRIAAIPKLLECCASTNCSSGRIRVYPIKFVKSKRTLLDRIRHIGWQVWNDVETSCQFFAVSINDMLITVPEPILMLAIEERHELQDIPGVWSKEQYDVFMNLIRDGHRFERADKQSENRNA